VSAYLWTVATNTVTAVAKCRPMSAATSRQPARQAQAVAFEAWSVEPTEEVAEGKQLAHLTVRDPLAFSSIGLHVLGLVHM
jgi:hypothetical protein